MATTLPDGMCYEDYFKTNKSDFHCEVLYALATVLSFGSCARHARIYFPLVYGER